MAAAPAPWQRFLFSNWKYSKNGGQTRPETWWWRRQNGCLVSSIYRDYADDLSEPSGDVAIDAKITEMASNSSGMTW